MPQNAANPTSPDGNRDENTLSEHDLNAAFSAAADSGGSVFKIPELVDKFVRYSWIIVTSKGDIYLNRWALAPNADANLIEEDNLSADPIRFHSWCGVSFEYTCDHLIQTEGIGRLEEVGDLTHQDGDLLADLENPREDTRSPHREFKQNKEDDGQEGDFQ